MAFITPIQSTYDVALKIVEAQDQRDNDCENLYDATNLLY